MAALKSSLRQKASSVIEISDDSDSDASCIEVINEAPPSKTSNRLLSSDADDTEDGEPLPFNARRSHTHDDSDTSPRSKFEARRRRLRRLAQKFSQNLNIGNESDDKFLTTEDGDNNADDEDDQSDSGSLDAFIDDSDDDQHHYEGYGVYSSDDDEEEQGAVARSSNSRYNTIEAGGYISDDEDIDTFTRRRRLLTPGAPKDNLRKSFRKLISKIETVEDLEKLYPASLHPTADSNATTNEAAVLTALAPREDIWRLVELELKLDEFEIYENTELNDKGKGTGGQLRSPFTPINAIRKKCELSVDGVLHSATRHQRVIGLQVIGWTTDRIMDPSLPSTEDHIYLETAAGQDRQLRYRLQTPATEYKDIWDDFVWLTDFTKYVFHYLWAKAQDQILVSLGHFSEDFWTFITNAYDGPYAPAIRPWHSKCNWTTDFRKHVIRYAQFLQSQAIDSDLSRRKRQALAAHELWGDLGVPMTKKQTRNTRSKTVVTSEVASAFLQVFPLWGPGEFDLFDIIQLSPHVDQAREKRLQDLHFPKKDISTVFPGNNFPVVPVGNEIISRAASELKAVQTNPRRQTFHTHQVSGTAIIVDRGRSLQYAYVRGPGRNPELVDVVWLQLPSEAIADIAKGRSFYPVGDELFFTDECSCQPVRLRDIRASFQVDIFSSRSSSANGFFVHALYRSDSKEVVVLDNPSEVLSEFACMRHSDKEPSELLELPPSNDVSKLKVQSLFSGCGLLDHSMSSTEYMDTVFAIEINEPAFLSHKANTRNSRCRHIHGSVNTALRDICLGREPYQDIDCTVAGCPCKGFSRLNTHKDKEKSHRNCSLLANTLSWISVCLPRYVLIENVTNMNSASKGGANACAQAICTLVSLGYQVTEIRLSGKNVNASSSRDRLFIVAAAPGITLPQHPTAFTSGEPTSAYEAIVDLDPIDNDAELNLSRPDHVPYERLNVDFNAGIALRDVVRRIPIDGRGRNLYEAHLLGRLTAIQEKWYRSQTKEKKKISSRSLRRVDADGFFPTITCSPVPINARGFECIHPFQHRVLTLEEIRRGQGVPDDFLLIGTTREAAEQVGNGVVWEVGVAWGLAIAQAAYNSKVTKKKEKQDGGKRKTIGHAEREERQERDSSVEFLEERPMKRARY